MAKVTKSKVKSSALADQLFPEEVENEVEVLNLPPEQRRLHTETFDFSVSTLMDYLKKGNVYIPVFQRGYVWTDQQASRLIESLIIQCPIPVIYLSQSKDETMAVVDGNQRINSIRRFINNEFSLKGLTAYPELADTKYFELDSRIQRHINNRTLRCIVILKETHPQVQFDVFERLNTGSNPLNAQELRHGLYYGTLMERLEKIATNKEIQSVFPKRYQDRMKIEELILRFLAIATNLNNYSQPVSAFLNEFSKKHKEANPKQINDLDAKFKSAVKNCRAVFGDDLFCKPPAGGELNQSFYVALFDAQLVAMASLSPSE